MLFIQIEALYTNAIGIQEREVEEIRRDERLVIPKDIDYESRS